LVFGNRRAAGERLAPLIAAHVRAPAVVLGIPRGGVVVAAAAAEVLGWPLGAVVTKKLGSPGNPELGIGAVAPGVRVLEPDVIAALGVSDEWIDREAARVEADVRTRVAALGSAVPQDLHGVTAVIVDDGVATGGTARAAGRWARARGAVSVVLAVPVAPQNVEARVGDAFDAVLAIETPSSFGAVGQFYTDFDQVGDAEMRDALEGAAS
jgi:putative phosphoribosyl transferase